VEQHNHHASLVEHGVAPLEESMKIHYFEVGIIAPLWTLLGMRPTACSFLTLPA
jgi:hypothetical protein